MATAGREGKQNGPWEGKTRNVLNFSFLYTYISEQLTRPRLWPVLQGLSLHLWVSLPHVFPENAGLADVCTGADADSEPARQDQGHRQVTSVIPRRPTQLTTEVTHVTLIIKN